MKILLTLCLVTSGNQFIAGQVLRPSYNFINRPGVEAIVEAGKYLPSPQPSILTESSVNSFVPIPNTVSDPGTTIITDCSPAICKNLVNTIQLMIVCHLLQNTKGNSEVALQLASPIINEVLSNPTLSCGCSNSISPVPANVVSSNYVTPTVAPYTSNILSHSAVPLLPTIVYPNNVMPSVGKISPSVPVTGQTPNTNDLLNTLMNLLGNVKM